MNDEFELQKRLRSADPGAAAPTLNEGVVAKAALSKKRGFTSFRAARLTMAAASLSIVGLAVSTLSLNLGPSGAPLFELAGAGTSQTPMSADARAEGSPMVSDKMMWLPVRYNYLAGELSTDTGQGKVYQAELVGDPIEILESLGRIFGISGEPKLDEWSSPEFPSYSIQGENQSLGIYFSGTASWYFSSWSQPDYGCPAVESTESSSGDGSEKAEEPQYCEPKPTPELIPAEQAMIAQALEIYGAIGITLDTSKARIYRDDWGASISFPNIQNGIETGQDYYLGWGMDGKISYAGGSSFRLVERGDFKTISALDAVARISDGRWFGGAPASYFQSITAQAGPAVLTETRDGKSGEEGFVGDEQPANPEPEIIDLLVNRSEAVTLTVYDAKGSLWLVPGYLLFNEQGWFDSIISLEEGVIALPEPMNYEIMPYLPEPAAD
jgi:hypothetical protein